MTSHYYCSILHYVFYNHGTHTTNHCVRARWGVGVKGHTWYSVDSSVLVEKENNVSHPSTFAKMHRMNRFWVAPYNGWEAPPKRNIFTWTCNPNAWSSTCVTNLVGIEHRSREILLQPASTWHATPAEVRSRSIELVQVPKLFWICCRSRQRGISYDSTQLPGPRNTASPSTLSDTRNPQPRTYYRRIVCLTALCFWFNRDGAVQRSKGTHKWRLNVPVSR